jgi:3-phenylpropionate/trans-cinnamate dioxygenase ferredoxin subunit
VAAVEVGSADDVPDGGALVVGRDVTGHDDAIALFRDGDALFALDDTCTHALASLAEGWVEDGAVECPLHGAQFCLRTGAALSLPATQPARTHRVEVVDGVVVLHPGEPARG